MAHLVRSVFAPRFSISVPDPVPPASPVPVPIGASLGADGYSLDVTFSRGVFADAGGLSGFSVTLSVGGVTPTYITGLTTSVLSFRLSRVIPKTVTLSVAYQQPTAMDGLRGSAAGTYVASFSAFSVVNGSGAEAGAYNPPIGVPDPALYFGGLNPVDTPKPTLATYAPAWFLPTPAVNSIANGYAHNCYYVDALAVNSSGVSIATDSSNTYGHPGKPRRSLPSQPSGGWAAGSVIYIVGNGATYGTGTWYTGGSGTPSAPIWVIGSGAPIITANIHVGGLVTAKNWIFDGLSLKGASLSALGRFNIRPGANGIQVENIVVRNCTLNGGSFSSSGIAIGASGSGVTSSMTTTNVVVYNCDIGWYGNKATPHEECGIYPTLYTTNIWILDSSIHDVAEDGCAGSHGGGRTTKNYFIGRCKIYNNLTNAVDLKGISRTIISECEMWGTVSGPGSTGPGETMIFHFGAPSTYNQYPDDVSVLFCSIRNGRMAVATSGMGRLRCIGNTVWLTRWDPAPTGATDFPAAFHLRDMEDEAFIVHNTIFDCQTAIRCWDSPAAYSPTKTYTFGTCTFNGAVYTIDSDGTSFVGIEPPNAPWRRMYITIAGNIISNGYGRSYADIRFDNRSYADGAVLMDHNLVWAPSDGGSYEYGRLTGLVDLNWVKLNTAHQANGISADPQLTDPSSGNFIPLPTSPAIDAIPVDDPLVNSAYDSFYAVWGIDIRKDLTGAGRPQGALLDMGAYEVTP